MFWASRVVLLSLIVPLAFSQTAQPPPPATGSVEGVVVRADTQEPLKKAWVTLERADGPGKPSGALTDAAGRFVLKEIEPGRYRLVADRNGFVRQQFGQQGSASAGTVLNISAGQRIRDILIAMKQGSVLSGHIYDDDGEPVVNGNVTPLKFVYRDGKRELQPVGFCRTNDLGEFRLYGLEAGTYFISATFSGWERPPLAGLAGTAAGSGEEMGFAPTFYPATNNLALAAPVEARAGEEVSGLDINLLTTRAVKIRGRILSPNSEKGEARAWVFLVPRESSKLQFFSPSVQANVNNREGEFELRGVVPGSYKLMANSFAGDEVYQARIPLEVGATDVEGLLVPLGKGIELPGRIRWQSDADQNADRKVRVWLESKEESFMMRGTMMTTNPDGTFTLKNVADGDYNVRVGDAPEDCYLNSATIRGEDVLGSGLSISGGQLSGALDITLSCAGATVEGTVAAEGGKPATGATVALVPEGERRALLHLFKSAATDQYGRFVLKGLAPGKYKVFAWDRMESGAYLDPEFLRRYESEGKPLTIGEGSRLEIQLSLISTGKPQP